ncbi:hypothetical protein [Mammaliicoccus sciuri]|uniref:hypothetical protein n=1 Tax=Mammaliicoccus sciuri TaxID=1296 RepID=UPI001C4F943E|nr:hypothetical protein [Mammaliicoccus sciuri]
MAKPTRDEVIDWAKKQNLDVDNFIDELDQYKTAHYKLTAGLKEAVAESIKYKRERDELSEKLDKECNMSLDIEGQLYEVAKQRDLLLEDISLLKKNQKTREEVIEQLKSENKALRLQADEYFELWQNLDSKHKKLTEHIKDKALNNPSEHRYFRLVHFIDDLEADTHDEG